MSANHGLSSTAVMAETHRGAVPAPQSLPLIDEAFAHTIAHDLRSPLTAIQMCAESLMLGGDPSVREKYAAVIAEQAKSIARSLEDLVAVADGHAGNDDKRLRLDLGQMAEECLDELSGISAARDVTVFIDAPRGTHPVEMMDRGLRQAIRGCAQALICTVPAGCELLVEASGDEGGETVSLCLIGRDGAAVPGDRLEGLELPWHRLSLLTASRLIEMHGGSVSELREPGALGLRIVLPTSQ